MLKPWKDFVSELLSYDRWLKYLISFYVVYGCHIFTTFLDELRYVIVWHYNFELVVLHANIQVIAFWSYN